MLGGIGGWDLWSYSVGLLGEFDWVGLVMFIMVVTSALAHLGANGSHCRGSSGGGSSGGVIPRGRGLRVPLRTMMVK